MKTQFLVAILGLAISITLPTFAQQKETLDPQLRQMIDAFANKYAAAVNHNDAAAIASLYAEDAVFLTSGGAKYGREAIKKFYADLFQQFHISNYTSKADQYSPHDICTAGTETLEIGEWSCTIQGQGGSPVELKGYYSSIYCREGEDWKIKMVSSNTTQ